MKYNVLKRIEVEAKSDKLKDLRNFVTKYGRKMGMNPRQINGLKLCIDEACSNVIRHAYTGLSQKNTVVIVEMFNAPQYVETRVIDYGKDVTIDVDALAKPDLQKYVDMGKKGGLGLFMIKKFMDEVIRKRENNANYLIMRKYVERPESYWSRVKKNLQWETMPIKVKFSIISTLTISVLLFTLYIYFLYTQKNSLTSQFLNNTENLARKTADNARSYLLGRQDLNLTLLLKEIQKRDNTIIFSEIINTTDDIIAHTDLKKIYKKFAPPQVQNKKTENDFEKGDILYNKEKLLYYNTPIKVMNFKIGELHMALSQSIINREIENLQSRLTLTFSTIFLWTVGILGSYFLGMIFIQPVKELTEEIKRVGKEGVAGRLYFKGKGELAEVATAFNKMMESIRVAEVELTDSTRLRKEMQLAQSIQQTLLPKTIPQIEGYDIGAKYEAAMEVGGDYYDFFEVDENSLGIAVGDVSGKGIGGALIMTMTRTALRLEARGDKNAAEVLAHLNATLNGEFKKGMYITMYYVVLDSKKRTINYSSAGHNPMILYRGDTGQVYNLNPKGFAVGLNLGTTDAFQKAIKFESIKLKKGDLLFIYTDGITEAMNSKREEYGEYKLLECIKKFNHLPAQEMADKVLSEIKLFTGDYPQSDDITFVIVKEKADVSEVEFNTRINLFKLIEEQKLSIKEACEQLNVSSAKYYYLKKLKDKFGPDGLKQDIDEEPREIELMDIETSQKMLEVIIENPVFSISQLQEALNTEKYGHLKLDTKIIARELKKLNLTTTEKRERFVKRQIAAMQKGKKSVFLRGGAKPKIITMAEIAPGTQAEKAIPAGQSLPVTEGIKEQVSSQTEAQKTPPAPSSFFQKLFRKKTTPSQEPSQTDGASKIKKEEKTETITRFESETKKPEPAAAKKYAQDLDEVKKMMKDIPPASFKPSEAEKKPASETKKPEPAAAKKYAQDLDEVKKMMKDIPPASFKSKEPEKKPEPETKEPEPAAPKEAAQDMGELEEMIRAISPASFETQEPEKKPETPAPKKYAQDLDEVKKMMKDIPPASFKPSEPEKKPVPVQTVEPKKPLQSTAAAKAEPLPVSPSPDQKSQEQVTSPESQRSQPSEKKSIFNRLFGKFFSTEPAREEKPVKDREKTSSTPPQITVEIKKELALQKEGGKEETIKKAVEPEEKIKIKKERKKTGPAIKKDELPVIEKDSIKIKKTDEIKEPLSAEKAVETKKRPGSEKKKVEIPVHTEEQLRIEEEADFMDNIPPPPHLRDKLVHK
ncbi:MAG: SpoIIE family protein phosphatase [bacterium]|nr:SpoIIE family protein phosphatase [bacterium]